MSYQNELNLWGISRELFNLLDSTEQKFVLNECGGEWNFEYYRERIKRIDFVNFEVVLDAGCGIGQWSVALASQNELVEACDINMSRLMIAREIASEQTVKNLRLSNKKVENVEELGLKVSAVFCYGVFMFTNKKKSVEAFAETLQDGGLLYLNYNSSGWWLYLLFEEGIRKRNYSIIKLLFKSFLKTIYQKDKRIFVTKRGILRLISKRGFKIIYVGPEGSYNPNKKSDFVRPKYESFYKKRNMVIEIIARKESK
jgi:ubiquinone/menaquinone biosynthesis C-methylase UbiE